TSGSTAITFLLRSFFKSIPVAVTPVQPSQSAVYAVASIVIVSPLVSDDDSDSGVSSCSSTSTSTSSTCPSSCLYSSFSGSSCLGSSCSCSSCLGSSCLGSSCLGSFCLGSFCLGSSFISLSFCSSDELSDTCFSEPLTVNVSPGTTIVLERLFHFIKSSNDTSCANAISLNVSPAFTVYVSPELAVIFLSGFS